MARPPAWNSVHRSSFARYEIVRKRIEEPIGGCSWCGALPRHRHPLYEYGVQHDDKNGRTDPARGQFCSTDCYCTYHNVTLDA